ncbi:rhamnogalacturonate lyase-like [Belonocnema kinseyi]|uniref:rhamnogalacturonate lyase-like n=1 Tax=Belonocnema kinseyi TaxID=2817044 RepID=UPI00143CE5E9|nr:rhamnogalacturonate lyase-like [Belonocnema kinseyi]
MMFQIPAYVTLVGIITFTFGKETSTPVSLVTNGLTAKLDNGLIEVSFRRSGVISSLIKNGNNLVANTEVSGYFDWNSRRNHRFSPSRLDVITKSPQHVHIMYSQDVRGFLKLEYHIIMEQGISGIYTYVKATNKNKKPSKLKEMRLIYVFNPKIMYQISNGVQEGTPPTEKELRKLPMIWDATWKLPNGTVYSKYDYAGYVRNTSYHGAFGNGFGAWVVSASHEYYSGGPLKQDLLVHQGPLVANYMAGMHFGTPALNAPHGWTKVYGPWLVYFNEGSDDQVKLDAFRQATVEQSLWPYKWMNDKEYPQKRATLQGKVTSSARSMVVISSSLKEDFDKQTLGYSYFTETDKTGFFELNKISPGTYKLTAYPIEGYGIGCQAEKVITIREGMNEASLELPVPTQVMWSIGETNRRSDTYRYSNERRSYVLQSLTPEDLEFEIGKSSILNDWYYAQTKKGNWNIKYYDTPDQKNRKLRIGLAATSFNVTLIVSVNGRQMKQCEYENDSAIYRCATQSGNFHSEAIAIPANQVVAGENVIQLTLRSGSVMYDSINFSIE